MPPASSRSPLRTAAPGALDERRDLGVEQRESKGLGDIVVCAQLIAQELVVLVGEGGEEENGHILVLSKCAADGKAVETRHHDVQEHRVKLPFLGAGQGFRAVRRRNGLVALAEEEIAEHLPQAAVVLRD